MAAEVTASPCHQHTDRPAVATCEDCGTGLCARCQVDIDTVGTFCWECAARRGGLRAGHRSLRAAVPPPPRPPVRPIPGASFDAAEGVRRFEERVADRPAHHLISGLSERLTEAGADPEDVVDDDALTAEIGHLLDLAAEDGRRHRRHRRHRR